jgi:anhydro-N-acetylmuramic acid kinase
MGSDPDGRDVEAATVAVGLMSGTSLDGIDAALIETDGDGLVTPIAFHSVPYSDDTRARLRDAMARALGMDRPAEDPAIDMAAGEVTQLHADAVRALLKQVDLPCSGVGVIGFHGQTIAHRPDRGWTWQIGDGQALADDLNIVVVDDLRQADVAAGGQGAPLLPVYHRAMLRDEERPAAVLNLGGLGNITFIGGDDVLVAFDTGPGNALIDDWVMTHTGARFDADGALAASGTVDATVLDAMVDQPWFDLAPPKSLDRADFSVQPARGLSAADGAATLTRFTVETVALALRLLPLRPTRLVVAGGGRRNATMMTWLAKACAVPVVPIEALGWNGDATEAEGFAYMAVRSLRGLPISFPGTTGVPRAITGGWARQPGAARGRTQAA